MREQATQFPDPIPPIVLTSPWRVVKVRALPDYCLKVRFLDGVEGLAIANMAALYNYVDYRFVSIRFQGVYFIYLVNIRQ